MNGTEKPFEICLTNEHALKKELKDQNGYNVTMLQCKSGFEIKIYRNKHLYDLVYVLFFFPLTLPHISYYSQHVIHDDERLFIPGHSTAPVQYSIHSVRY